MEEKTNLNKYKLHLSAKCWCKISSICNWRTVSKRNKPATRIVLHTVSRDVGRQTGRVAGGRAGRRASGQAGKRAGGRAGRRAGGQVGRRTGGQAAQRSPFQVFH